MINSKTAKLKKDFSKCGLYGKAFELMKKEIEEQIYKNSHCWEGQTMYFNKPWTSRQQGHYKGYRSGLIQFFNEDNG